MSDKEHILAELRRLYPEAKPELHFSNPYETLVATMLSAQCTDKQVNKVTEKLFPLFPDAFAMAKLSAEELHPYIASCGFRSKADNITAACRILVEQYGGQVPRTMDTHVFRVSNRLGLADARDVLQTERQLMEAIAREDWIEAHHWLIYHGRRVCGARRPACERCTLASWCKYARQAREAG